MANQIASFFNGSGPEAAVKDAADHISKFWDPRMRTMLLAHLETGGVWYFVIRPLLVLEVCSPVVEPENELRLLLTPTFTKLVELWAFLFQGSHNFRAPP